MVLDERGRIDEMRACSVASRSPIPPAATLPRCWASPIWPLSGCRQRQGRLVTPAFPFLCGQSSRCSRRRGRGVILHLEAASAATASWRASICGS